MNKLMQEHDIDAYTSKSSETNKNPENKQKQQEVLLASHANMPILSIFAITTEFWSNLTMQNIVGPLEASYRKSLNLNINSKPDSLWNAKLMFKFLH